MFPLNIGYLASYLLQDFSDDVEVKLFKFPNDFIQGLKDDPPEIVGFSHYIWNADINSHLASLVKKISRNTLNIFGGPNIDYTDDGIKRFFNRNPNCDLYVPYQGERPFKNIVSDYILSGRDNNKLYRGELDGTFKYDKPRDIIIKGRPLERIKEPDSINSPYLTGLFDEFFETNLIPIVETNRGCPFRCTFCAQGLSSFNSLNYFSYERVIDEIKYVAKKVKKTKLLHFADANFGIVNRDIDIARACMEFREQYGYPLKVSSNYAKNRPPEKMIEIGKLFGETAVIVSLQSLDDYVLQRVKRKNIKTSNFKEIIKNVNKLGGLSGTEIILGLPGETKESHCETIKELFDMNASYIIAYNALILEGTELSDEKYSGDFECTTKFRLIDSSFGEYFAPLSQAHNVTGSYNNDILSFEVEEGIRSTDTMTEDEILNFRPVHWLIQFMWNYRFYYDFLKYVQFLGINPYNYITRMIKLSTETKLGGVNKILNEFRQEAMDEWFDSVEELRDHYSKTENLSELKDGIYGKMNGKYIFKVLVEIKSEFEAFLLEVVRDFPELCNKINVFEELISFHSNNILEFSGDIGDIQKIKCLYSNYNIFGWRESSHSSDLETYFSNNSYEYIFELTDATIDSLNSFMSQYKHSNLNLTLRKMSEYMPIKDFFYSIRVGAAGHSGSKSNGTASNLIEIQEGRQGVGQ